MTSRLLFGFMCLVLSVPAAAQQRAASAAPTPQAGLGRLFFSPAQRLRLDAKRTEAIENARRPQAPKVTEAAPPTPQAKVVTLNGIVRRSDGEATVWVNGQPMNDGFSQADIAVGSVGRDSVGMNLPSSGKRVRLKVGQSVESVSGVVEESYRRQKTLPVAGAGVDVPNESSAPTAAPAVEGAATDAVSAPR